jgi:hypothetical protein
MSVYEKLLTVQRKLNAPKSKYNKFGGYNYRSCEDILDGVKPLLVEVKATLYLTDDVVQIAERIYVKTTAKFVDIESGEFVENTAFAREPLVMKGMADRQITGASSTYARKYALNGLFCIDDTVDEDTSETSDDDRKKLEQAKKQADKEALDKQKAQKQEQVKNEQDAQKTDEQKNTDMKNSVDPRLLPTEDDVMSKAQYDFLMEQIERTGAHDDVVKYAKTDDLSKLNSKKCVAILIGLLKRPTKEQTNG